MPDASPLRALRRRLNAWTGGRCAGMPPEAVAERRRIDDWLQSRDALGFWVGLLSALAATVAGLIAGGFPWPLALGVSLMVGFGVPGVALSAWLQPQKFTTRRLLRNAVIMGLTCYVFAFVGFLVIGLVRRGQWSGEALDDALQRTVSTSPALIATLLGAMLLLLWGVAQIRSHRDQRDLARLTLAHERDGAARQAAEAQLHRLQAQIQPHFLFNTLAALQHWVDVGDPRASALLRDLTEFLRASTELLAHPEVTLRDEADAARRYLQIMQARFGTRLQFEFDLAAPCLAHRLPSGILLTLVENAVEHGIAPMLKGGLVQVLARCEGGALDLQVRDDGAGPAASVPMGLGLNNCRERLRHRYGERASLTIAATPPGCVARLTLAAAA